MSVRVGINGFGRMGRLALRSAWGWPDLEFVQVNEPAGDAHSLAHLMNFDSVHGRWEHEVGHRDQALLIEGRSLRLSANATIDETDWSGCDLVIEASGQFRRVEQLNDYLRQGVKRVVVTAPVKEAGALNLVMGVNDHLYDREQHRILTAASCTTNCLAPMVKVLHESIGIRHGAFTTIHDITNTQSILDQPHKDLRRARACGMSLIPTTTGSATAIMEIYPELKGRLDGHAVRVPLANASITDAQFELNRETSIEEVNRLFKEASEGSLRGIFGYEERPLVSIDYRSDRRSGVLDGSFTRVVNGTLVKLYAWYDNEMGYANRTVELARKVAREGV
ncbi:ArsJ-associated glyceraldehyde-3-phosphate dehydrogenase [Aestuariirhabdus litorea]|uniref:Glyceraldehyde-3-phosphate dehydrogenase n=1 Tax=Aestuariirhabdus litorea TaxID=2528527 RepID=A0A3P3VTD0_9GAMM|nr:ArsJ-associated glyceraldehyde-3-phosphate dehydrogenase [Aestuariirhabdus litorea]RRJ84729.1 glyceraldehyde-3-phosphate dehydrogenase [Aestuariirhabdus litorea]RWW97954.1 ArsJ-associated glyceraldehyde-3-phosphate dehydrogenase [Endozoicomonadaceae bacterium GTF-13]